MTKDLELAKVPRYKLINRTAGGRDDSHIVNAAVGSGDVGGAKLLESPKDTDGKTAWGTVDQNPMSCYLLETWDSGGFNLLGNHGLVYEFDQAYQMKMITLQEQMDQDTSYGYAQIRYWDADGKESSLSHGEISVQKKTDVEEIGRAHV